MPQQKTTAESGAAGTEQPPDGAPAEATDDAPGTATVADLPRLAQAAPGATPDGARVYLASDEAEAWMADDIGYLRLKSDLDRAVSLVDIDRWAEIVDSLGMVEGQAPPTETTIPDPQPAADSAGQQTKAAAPEDTDVQTGIMVALMVPEGDSADLVLDHPAALPAGELHITLAYLGDTSEVDDQGDYVSRVLEALRDVAAHHGTLAGQVSGIGRFSDDDGDAFYLSFDSPDLPELRQDVVQALDRVGIDNSRDHGFSPHITLTTLSKGDGLPMTRAATRAMAFDRLTFAFGDARIEVPLEGDGDTDEEDPENSAWALGLAPDSTAPSVVDAKAGAAVEVKAGTHVRLGDGTRGLVDLVVTRGTVPGVADAPAGTAEAPVARVIVGGTGAKVAVPVTDLKRAALPPDEVPDADSMAQMLALYARHRTNTAGMLADSTAVKAVYERGLASWPGTDISVAREQWALGRVTAFLATVEGKQVPGYTADRDLLPEGRQLAGPREPEPTRPQAPLGTPQQESKTAEPHHEERTVVIAAEDVAATLARLLR